MDAWPIEEVWLRPASTPLLCLVVPFVTAWVLRAVLFDDARQIARAVALVGLAQLELAWWLGVTALGPRLVDQPGAWASHAFGAACALVTLAATGRALRWPFAPKAFGVMSAASIAAAAACALAEAPRGVGALAVGAAWWPTLRVWGRRVDRSRGGGVASEPAPSPACREREGEPAIAFATGAVVSGLLVASAALAWTLTEIDVSDAPEASGGSATWRLRVDPWDPAGMLAAAWASRERGELERAVVQAREARRMGLSEAPALELEAEVLAARGRCAEARETFDRALRARAERMFEDDPLAATLSLGGYHLPPTLVSACDGLDALPALELPALDVPDVELSDP